MSTQKDITYLRNEIKSLEQIITILKYDIFELNLKVDNLRIDLDGHRFSELVEEDKNGN